MNKTSKKNLKCINLTKSNLCRLCLHEGAIPIFGDESYENIQQHVLEITGVNVDINDKLPKYLCSPCYSLLQGALLLQNKVLKTSNILSKCTKILMNDNLFVYLNLSENDKVNKFSGTISDTLNFRKNRNGLKNINNDKLNYNTICEDSTNSESLDVPKGNEYVEISTTIDDTDSQIFEIDNKELSDIETLSLSAISEHGESKNERLDIIGYDDTKINTTIVDETRTGFQLLGDIKKQLVKCPICLLNLERHKFKKHFDSHPGTDEKRYKCYFCGRLYKRSYYYRHVNSHWFAKICNYCNKVFLTNSDLSRHVIKHIDEFPYKCPQCPYRGKTKYSVKNHSYFHTKEKQILCSICGKKISNQNNYIKHLNMHQNRRNFSCDICKKTFYTKYDLRGHIKSNHLGINDFVCKLCNKAFPLKSYLRSHENFVHKRPPLPQGGPHYLRRSQKC